VLPRPAEAPASRPKYEHTAESELADKHRETWAWLARLEAEVLRLRHATERDAPPSAAELVDAWRASEAAFERYGHVFELARSRARLAAALHLAGDDTAARSTAAQARQVAERLGAVPLLAELDALFPTGSQRGTPAGGSGGSELTPREAEVLALLASGLTNGQIGKRLYISTKTVSVHVSNLLAKLGASGRTEAAAIARERGLLG
jgi:DNA-binding CsgD family transcriptional regulator